MSDIQLAAVCLGATVALILSGVGVNKVFALFTLAGAVFMFGLHVRSYRAAVRAARTPQDLLQASRYSRRTR